MMLASDILNYHLTLSKKKNLFNNEELHIMTLILYSKRNECIIVRKSSAPSVPNDFEIA